MNRRTAVESDPIRYTRSMKTLTITEVARNFSAVLDGVERGQKETRDARCAA
jgi:hypothetical protein